MKNYKLSIAYYDTGRVYFTVETAEDLREYRTNQRGEGLWLVSDVADKQIRGTCQFSTTGNRSTDRRTFIRELMLDE